MHLLLIYNKIAEEILNLYMVFLFLIYFDKKGVIRMKMRINSKTQEERVTQNIGLVYYIVKKYNIQDSDYEDVVSIGTIGLIKAAISFDSSKGIKFGTYAAKCIRNEIFMHYRKEKKREKDISMCKNIQRGENSKPSKPITIEENLEDVKADVLKKIMTKEELIYALNIILNYMTGKDRLLMLYKMAGLNQREIAKKLQISQSYVSRKVKRNQKKLEEYMEKQLNGKESFSIEIIGEEFRIVLNEFSAKEFQDLPCVSFEKERMVVQMPILPESFLNFAKIIQKIPQLS